MTRPARARDFTAPRADPPPTGRGELAPELGPDEYLIVCPRCNTEAVYFLAGGVGQWDVYECSKCGRQTVREDRP